MTTGPSAELGRTMTPTVVENEALSSGVDLEPKSPRAPLLTEQALEQMIEEMGAKFELDEEEQPDLNAGGSRRALASSGQLLPRRQTERKKTRTSGGGEQSFQ